MVISCYIPQIVFCTTLVFVRLSPENLDGYIPFYPIRSLSNQHGHGHLWQRCNERDACLGANNKAEALMRHLCHEKPHDRRAPPLAESHSSSSGFSWEGLQNASQIGGGCAPQEAPSDAPRSVTVKMSPHKKRGTAGEISCVFHIRLVVSNIWITFSISYME